MFDHSLIPEIPEVTAATPLAERFMQARALMKHVTTIVSDLDSLLAIVLPLARPQPGDNHFAGSAPGGSAGAKAVSRSERRNGSGSGGAVKQGDDRPSRKKFSDQQIIDMVSDNADLTIDEIANRHGISVATLYARKRTLLPGHRTKGRPKVQGPTVATLAEQNEKLKAILEEQGREIQKLKAILGQKE